jgi:hypothetical protein
MVNHCCFCSRTLGKGNPSLQFCKKLSKQQRKVLLTYFGAWNDEELDLLLDKYDPARSKTPLFFCQGHVPSDQMPAWKDGTFKFDKHNDPWKDAPFVTAKRTVQCAIEWCSDTDPKVIRVQTHLSLLRSDVKCKKAILSFCDHNDYEWASKHAARVKEGVCSLRIHLKHLPYQCSVQEWRDQHSCIVTKELDASYVQVRFLLSFTRFHELSS